MLENHQQLTSLNLANLQITGEGEFGKILDLIHRKHDRLENFASTQIAENTFRTYFGTLGAVMIADTASYELGHDPSMSFFMDFVWVDETEIYDSEIEKWEGVQARIGLLRNDLRISDRTFEPENPGGGDYVWED